MISFSSKQNLKTYNSDNIKNYGFYQEISTNIEVNISTLLQTKIIYNFIISFKN